MVIKRLAAAMLAAGVLGGGLYGCSEGDSATINIDAPTDSNDVIDSNNTTNNNTGGTDTGDGGTTDPAVECPAGTTETSQGVCELSGAILSDMTLVAGNEYHLNGRVIVGNGNCELADKNTCASGVAVRQVTLTIEAGVEVKGLPSNDPLKAAVLDVNRGSRLMAMGTASAPIVFSSLDADYSTPGEWGGIQLSGYAPHNKCTTDPCNVDGEGAVNFIGGDDPADSSGVLQYVVIAEGGTELSTGDEINGLSLNAVGSGTTMENIQIHDNLDDGVEFYGGTANIKYLVVTGAGDDSVDWDEGYQGNLQYVFVKQSAASGGEAFEMDTLGDANTFLSKPTVANVTVIADKAAGNADYSLNFKKESAGFFHNTVVTVSADTDNVFTTCANIIEGSDQNLGDTLVFNNWIQDCANGTANQGELANVDMTGAAINVNTVFANLNSLGASQAAEARLAAAVDWAQINTDLPLSVADVTFLDATDYIGAVDPDATSAWWDGWTIEGSVGNPESAQVACPTGTTEVTPGICKLPSSISSDMRLIAGNEYQIEGRVIVGNGNCELADATTCLSGSSVQNVTLTIDAGVEVKGLPSNDPLRAAVLDVNRGSRLVAIGTKQAPIIFSSADDDYEDAGEWGGIQLSGFAPHNKCVGVPCNVDGEGGVNFIGGENAADSSGTLKYVIITEGGTELSTGDEINGLSLNAVGSGTVIDFVQINDNLDDGVEYYGGTVNTKHLVVTGAGDDSVDWDEGFQGNIQYVLVKQTSASGGEAFEMDTLGDAGTWLSKPTVVNGTVIADGADTNADYILNFKKESAGFFHNMVVTYQAGTAATYTTCANVIEGSAAYIGLSLVFNNWIQDCASDGTGGSLSNENGLDNGTITAVGAALDSLYASQAAAAAGLEPIDWTIIEATFEVPGSDAADPQTFDATFFDDTTYMGAVNPDGTDPWWAGWTLEGTL